MNIVYATSDLYGKPALVSIKSLLMSNADVEELHIYYVEDHVAEQTKQLMKELVNGYGRDITFIPMPDICRAFPQLVTAASICISYCFFPEILPPDVERVLLLESDCIVTQSLNELYGLDLGGCYLAAADDLQSKWYKRKLGLANDDVYFNSGVMLYDLAKWRRDGLCEKLQKVLAAQKAEVFYAIQDELNIAVKGAFKLMPPRFNSTTAIFLFDYQNMRRYRKPSTCCTEKEFEEARKAPVIVHFTRNQIIQSRPWIEGCSHPYDNYYLSLKAQTPLRDECLWQQKRVFVNYLAFFLYKRAPGLTARVLGAVHAWLYPVFLHRFMMR